MSAQLPVVLTRHAAERLEARGHGVRFPDAVTARLEIGAAFRDGRVATRQPGFLGPRLRRSSRTEGTVRFVWPADETRCYVVKRERGSWVVLTVLVPHEFVGGPSTLAQAFQRAGPAEGTAA
jgi:hypothetical protein